MAIILKFRMLTDENDHFIRDFDVPADITLLDLHNFIVRALGYDDCMASFFTADDRWEHKREFTLMDMGGGMDARDDEAPLPMGEVLVGQVIRRVHDRLVWFFDMFANRAYYLEVMDAAEPVKGRGYPCVTFEHAEAPDQYDPEMSDGDSRSIFEEMMGDYNDFEGDDSYDDEY